MLSVERRALKAIHESLHAVHGCVEDEYPQQLMIARYVRPDATVLQLRGNVGVSSCVIASILDDSSRLVVLESATATRQVRENRDANGQSFRIETLKTLKTLKTRDFDTPDTLVASCEAALLDILRDHPGFLKRFTTVLLEHDSWTLAHKKDCDAALASHGLRLVRWEVCGWGPCQDRYYEAWVKVEDGTPLEAVECRLSGV